MQAIGKEAAEIFRLADALSNLYPMDREEMGLLDAMLLDHAKIVQRAGGGR
jgi:predicted RNA polymerase sigma factor